MIPWKAALCNDAQLIGGTDILASSRLLAEAGSRVSDDLFARLVVNVIHAVPIWLGLWLIGVPNALFCRIGRWRCGRGAVPDGGDCHPERDRALVLRAAHRGQPAGGMRIGDVPDLVLGINGADRRHAFDGLPDGGRPSCAQHAAVLDLAGGTNRCWPDPPSCMTGCLPGIPLRSPKRRPCPPCSGI